MKYICIKKCFFKNRLWKPGETLAFSEGEEVSKYFEKQGKKIVKKEVVQEEPKTLKELQQEMAKEALDSIGRGEQAAQSFETKVVKPKKAKVKKEEAIFS